MRIYHFCPLYLSSLSWKEADPHFREAAVAKNKSISIHFRLTVVRQRRRELFSQNALNKSYRVIKSSVWWKIVVAKQKHEEILLLVRSTLST